MLSAGGHVPTQTEAPASNSALAMANPNPASSATPATSARFPVRSMASMRARIARGGVDCKPRRGYHLPMSRKGWEGERTLADAEQDEREGGVDAPTRCACGSTRFVLEAFLEIDEGVMNPEPVESESLTCPECGREYEPIFAGGRVLRGEFRGFFEDDED